MHACENIHAWVLFFFFCLYINVCMGVYAYVCLNRGSSSENSHLREDKACVVDALHGVLCVLCLRVCHGPITKAVEH